MTDRACRQRASQSIKRLSDGGGMFLEIHPSGSRYWRLAYRFDGKQKQLAFGVFPDVPLGTARQKRDEARALLASGIDPAQHRQQAAHEAKRRAAAAKSLRDLSGEWFLVKMDREAKSEATKKRNRSLLRYLKAVPLGDRPAAAIEAPELLDVLRTTGKRPVGNGTPRPASRVTYFPVWDRDGRMHARSCRRPNRRPHRLHLHPARSDHRGRRVRQLLRDIRSYDGMTITRLALEMLALTFVRPGEVRHMEWGEIDLDQAKWTIPAAKMKMRLEHDVPLSKQTLVS